MTERQQDSITTKAFSRFQRERLLDPCYLCSFYKEHSENINDFVKKLLEVRTISRLISNGKEFALKYSRTQWNLEQKDASILKFIEENYEKMETMIHEDSSPRELLLTWFNDYFCASQEMLSSLVLGEHSMSIEEFRKELKKTWNLPAGQSFKSLRDKLLGNVNTTNERNLKWFFPQLFLFFARFFEVYDNAAQGRTVSQIMQQLREQEKKEHLEKGRADSEMLKSIWNTANSHAPIGPTEIFHYDRNEEPSNPQIEDQLENLKEAYESALMDWKALYNYKGKEFIEHWNGISNVEEKKSWLSKVRQNISERAEMGIVYCPELNSNDLANDNEKGLLDLFEHISAFTMDISQMDSFVSKVWLQMKAKGIPSKKALLTIIYSRRWVLLTFGVGMIMEVLRLGQENSDSTVENNRQPTEIAMETPPAIIENSALNIDQLASKMTERLNLSSKVGPVNDKTNPLEKSSLNTKGKPIQTNRATMKTANLLRYCSLPECSLQETKENRFSLCGKCKAAGISIPYCSVECQRKHWTRHKVICGIIDKASIHGKT